MKYKPQEKVYLLLEGKLCCGTVVNSHLKTNLIGPKTTVVSVEIPGKTKVVKVEDRNVVRYSNIDVVDLMATVQSKLSHLSCLFAEMSMITENSFVACGSGHKTPAVRMAELVVRFHRVCRTVDKAFMKIAAAGCENDSTILADVMNTKEKYANLKAKYLANAITFFRSDKAHAEIDKEHAPAVEPDIDVTTYAA